MSAAELIDSEKVVSLFIHIMPPVVLHTILHLMPRDYALERYPALKAVPYLGVWRGFWISSVVHSLWQLWYYLFIMVRRKEKIAAGRPTSFTWLRRSYAKTWIGKWVNGFPEPLPQFAFMFVQVRPRRPTKFLNPVANDIVHVLAVDGDAMSDMVFIQNMVNDLRLHGLWLVSMERRNILRRHLWQTLPKGIGRLTCRSRKMAKQSAGEY